MNIDAKYLHHRTKEKIVRLRVSERLRIWRIAKDCNVTAACVVDVLISNGVPRVSMIGVRELKQ